MVEVLLAAVLLLTALSLLNLLLLWGVVRRLREHETRLSKLAPGAPEIMDAAVGQQLSGMVVSALDGAPVTLPPEAPALYGFFSPSCDACHERLADFRRAASAHPGVSVAVVVRDGGDVDALSGGLADMTTVVEEAGSGLNGAFGVRAFPAFALLSADGTLRARGFELPLPVAEGGPVAPAASQPQPV